MLLFLNKGSVINFFLLLFLQLLFFWFHGSCGLPYLTCFYPMLSFCRNGNKFRVGIGPRWQGKSEVQIFIWTISIWKSHAVIQLIFLFWALWTLSHEPQCSWHLRTQLHIQTLVLPNIKNLRFRVLKVHVINILSRSTSVSTLSLQKGGNLSK